MLIGIAVGVIGVLLGVFGLWGRTRARRVLSVLGQQVVPVEWLEDPRRGRGRTSELRGALLVEADVGKVTMEEMEGYHELARLRGLRHVFFVAPGSPVLCLWMREPAPTWQRKRISVAEVEA